MLNSIMRGGELLGAAAVLKTGLKECFRTGRASMTVRHRRAYDRDDKTGLLLYREVDEPETVYNLITNAGRIFVHTQGYGTTGLGANGLNYIALSNDTVTETAASTVLSNEIAANGLTRAQGTVTLPTGSGTQTTVDRTFTATGTVSAQKAGLFTAASAGTMNHVLGFTQRNLINSDTLQITFTITLA
jgi:hypothetical protein